MADLINRNRQRANILFFILIFGVIYFGSSLKQLLVFEPQTPYPAIPAALFSILSGLSYEALATGVVHSALILSLFLTLQALSVEHISNRKILTMLVLAANPLFLWSTLSLSSLALVTSYSIALFSVFKIHKLPIYQGAPFLGLTIAGLFFSSPYALYILLPFITGIFFLLPIRLLTNNMHHVMLIIFLPLIMSLFSAAYWFTLQGHNAWIFLQPAQTESSVLEVPSVWRIQYDGNFVTITAIDLVWSGALCFSALKQLAYASRHSSKTILFAVLVPITGLALASHSQANISPLPYFTCLIVANAICTGTENQKDTLFSLGSGWIAGAILVWLYAV